MSDKPRSAVSAVTKSVTKYLAEHGYDELLADDEFVHGLSREITIDVLEYFIAEEMASRSK